MKCLVDTNVFREIGKSEPNRNVAAWLSGVDDVDLAISVLTVCEVAKGIARLRAGKPDVAASILRRVNAVFDAFGENILPVCPAVARVWGEMLAERDKDMVDVGLAATARVHRLVVVSRNVAHLSRRGVRVLDPFARPARG